MMSCFDAARLLLCPSFALLPRRATAGACTKIKPQIDPFHAPSSSRGFQPVLLVRGINSPAAYLPRHYSSPLCPYNTLTRPHSRRSYSILSTHPQFLSVCAAPPGQRLQRTWLFLTPNRDDRSSPSRLPVYSVAQPASPPPAEDQPRRKNNTTEASATDLIRPSPLFQLQPEQARRAERRSKACYFVEKNGWSQ